MKIHMTREEAEALLTKTLNVDSAIQEVKVVIDDVSQCYRPHKENKITLENDKFFWRQTYEMIQKGLISGTNAKIHMIKLIRTGHDVGLAEAKTFVESL